MKKVFLMNDKLYYLLDKSERRGEAIIRDCDTDERFMMSLAKLRADKQPVYKRVEVADMFNMEKKNLEWWIWWLEIPYYEIIFAENIDNPVSSKRSRVYYSKQQVLDLYDMIIRVRKTGKPAKDKFKPTRYTQLPTRPELLAQLNESETYYMKKDGEFVPVFRPEWS